MANNFNPRNDTQSFAVELLAAVETDRYTPDEVARATEMIIRSEEFFPKVSTFLKALERQRLRQSSRRAAQASGIGDAVVLDHGILVGWIVGDALPTELWRRVAPTRMIAGEWDNWPAHSDMDHLIPGWLELASPQAIARTLDDLQLARDERVKGEPRRIERLREALRLDIGDFSGGLTPSERVELIERRMEELRAERRAS